MEQEVTHDARWYRSNHLVESMKQKVCCYGDFSDEDYKGVGLDGIFDLLGNR